MLQMSVSKVHGESSFSSRQLKLPSDTIEITMLIGRNVLKLMSTVIRFHHLPLLMAVEVSPQPLPCKPCSVLLLLLLLNCLHPP